MLSNCQYRKTGPQCPRKWPKKVSHTRGLQGCTAAAAADVQLLLQHAVHLSINT
jgi:hypothetical protein